MKKTFLIGCFLFLTWLAGALFPGAAILAEDAPMPLVQTDKFIMKVSMGNHHEALVVSLNSLDVAGVPEQTGKDNPPKRRAAPEYFKRTLTPNANGCVSCHYLPYAKGVSEAPGGNG